MGDFETSLMLLTRKASRKLRDNSLLDERVAGWLEESIRAYQEHSSRSPSADSEPHWNLITTLQTPEEDALFIIALFDGDQATIAAGRGEMNAVQNFCSRGLPNNPREIIEAARALFNVQERALNWSVQELLQRLPSTNPGAGHFERTYSSIPVSSVPAATPIAMSDETQQSLESLLSKAAYTNTDNLLSAAAVTQWLPELLEEIADEVQRFPEEENEPQWGLLAADSSFDEDAVFVIVLIDGEEIRLAAGRGEVYAVREFDDEIEDAREAISLARATLHVEDEEITFTRSALQSWIDGS